MACLQGPSEGNLDKPQNSTGPSFYTHMDPPNGIKEDEYARNACHEPAQIFIWGVAVRCDNFTVTGEIA
jgi:hypothetical protein